MNKFKQGDEVYCVRGSASLGLDAGTTWTVTASEGFFIYVEGMVAALDHSRFVPYVAPWEIVTKTKPQVVRSENVKPFDVDGTLILHAGVEGHPSFRKITVYDAVEKKNLEFTVHEPMVRLLLEEHHRGSFIIVWSRSGYEWANAVVEALGISDKVNFISSKPTAYFDDVPVENWLKERVFLTPDHPYKK